MPTCFVPGCDSGYLSCSSKRHLFKVREHQISQWLRAIPRQDRQLTVKCYVCELHFDQKYILTTFKHNINGQDIEIPRDKWTLSADAYPTNFPNLPSYLSKKLPAKRKSPTKRQNNINRKETNKKRKTQSSSPLKELLSVEENDILANEPRQESKETQCDGEVICRRQLYLMENRLKKAEEKIKRIQQDKSRLHSELVKVKKKLEIQKGENLDERQTEIINHMVKSATVKNNTGMRYSKNWLLDCMLLRIRSTSQYEFLRKNKFLPLPSKVTLQSYISAIDAKYGFDEQLFITLKEKLSSLELCECRGVLMFDEISLQEHLEYRKSTGELIGLVDYGESIQNEQKDVANHALVFLFQPHLNGWRQTIGTFSSKGAVPGAVLCKLIIEAIIHLENCGAVVDAIICDGASTNRSALTKCGINGSIKGMKNSFTNPVHPSRKIYVIFDVPHIIKCIRNVFVSKRVFDTQDGLVKMEHFETVYSEDIKNPPGLRNAPRLQREHLHPNNFQKQCVATAVQLFGGTVAKAMEFYKNRGIKQLEESGPTICFINRINTLFDALNRKLPSHGIRLNSSDLIEIELAISWLNNWEVHIKEKHPQNWGAFLDTFHRWKNTDHVIKMGTTSSLSTDGLKPPFLDMSMVAMQTS